MLPKNSFAQKAFFISSLHRCSWPRFSSNRLHLFSHCQNDIWKCIHNFWKFYSCTLSTTQLYVLGKVMTVATLLWTKHSELGRAWSVAKILWISKQNFLFVDWFFQKFPYKRPYMRTNMKAGDNERMTVVLRFNDKIMMKNNRWWNKLPLNYEYIRFIV